jgi:hypothetical protein
VLIPSSLRPVTENEDINDFRQSDHDKIDVRAYGFHDIADMTITADGSGNTRIAFDANDSVTLLGISDPHILHASDFFLFDLLGSDTAAMAKPPGAVPSACWHPCLLSGASIPASRMGVPWTSGGGGGGEPADGDAGEPLKGGIITGGGP